MWTHKVSTQNNYPIAFQDWRTQHNTEVKTDIVYTLDIFTFQTQVNVISLY